MASDQLIEAIELYDKHERDKDPSGRVEACQKMWETKNPEAIEPLSIIYREDPHEKVKAAAAAALRNFRQLQLERQNKDSKSIAADVATTKGGGVSKGATNFLIFTLVLLLAANAAVFFMQGSSKQEEDTTPSRSDVINEIRGTYTAIIADAQGLQEEWDKIGQLNDQPNCNRNFNRPLAPQLSDEEATLYPDLVGLFDPINGDLAFTLLGLDTSLQYWDSGCAAGEFDPNEAATYSGRLSGVIDTANIALGNLTILATPPTPTPDPADLLPVVRDRARIVADIRARLTDVTIDVSALQEEMTKVRQGIQPDCSRTLIRPQMVELSQAEAEAFPDLLPLVDPNNSDLAFALQGLDIGLQTWDGWCQTGTFDTEQATNTIGRLQTTMSSAMMALSSLP
ncbi:MAG: hypothetical protein H6673_12395 [Anaerolineales bacterium]|nr:hypothetical protein [Anaerolineales bacterium]